jgi:hypothetical protein
MEQQDVRLSNAARVREWDSSFRSRRRGLLQHAWSILNRPLKVVVAGALALTVVAMADSGPTRTELQEEVQRLHETVTAREGELTLVRLQLGRLDNILRESGRHHIPADLAETIYDVAQTEGIEPRLAFSLVRVESSFARRAVSPAGAVGLTQVMPSTAFWLDPSLRYPDLFEQETNLRLGFRYLRKMIDQYRGDIDLALLAYNRGPGRVDEILRSGGDPSNGYDQAVLEGR